MGLCVSYIHSFLSPFSDPVSSIESYKNACFKTAGKDVSTYLTYVLIFKSKMVKSSEITACSFKVTVLTQFFACY